MEKLMKPSEYAQKLGISRQAVYAKIKRGILTAKNVEGKLYIVVDKETTPAPQKKTVNEKMDTNQNDAAASSTDVPDYKALLKAKDETISVLKNTVKDLKKSNKQITTTLKGEIDLLKEAFYEMRTLYVHQLEHQKSQESQEEAIDILTDDEVTEEKMPEKEGNWISMKRLFKQYKITKEKAQNKIMKRLKKAYKQGDDRVMKVENKLKFNADKSYSDILNS